MTLNLPFADEKMIITFAIVVLNNKGGDILIELNYMSITPLYWVQLSSYAGAVNYADYVWEDGRRTEEFDPLFIKCQIQSSKDCLVPDLR